MHYGAAKGHFAELFYKQTARLALLRSTRRNLSRGSQKSSFS